MDRRIVWLWCGFAASVAGVSMTFTHVANAQSATPLTFARPAAQGSGTSGLADVWDPTILTTLPNGPPAGVLMAAAFDLQGNGRPDVVACHGSFPPYPEGKVPCRVLRPQPDGSVADVTRQLFGSGELPQVTYPSQIVAGDFNGDGRLDIFVPAFGYDTAPWPGEINVLLISNADGTYTDRSSTLPQLPANAHRASVGDVNGDGTLDIYVCNTYGQNAVGPYFLLGRGDGTFTQQTSGLPPQIQQLDERFTASALVDVDQDGFQDLVLGSHNVRGYFDNIVLFNDGTGDFTKRPRLVLPPGPVTVELFVTLDIASLDINRDGRPDLILVSTATYQGLALQVLINRGDGTFADESTARLGASSHRPTGTFSPFVRVADLNGDGWEDLYLEVAYDDPPTNHPRVWLNNGNGTWNPVSPTALPWGLVDRGGLDYLHAVDFEGDGRLDMLQLVPPGPPHMANHIGYRSFMNRSGLPPLAPGALTATPPGPSVTISWQAADLATSYQVEAGSAPGLSDLFIGNVGTATSLSAAPPARLYYARVRAVNAFGVGGPSNEVALQVGSCPLPFPPASLSSSVSGSEVALSWSAAAGASSYVLEAGSLPGASNVFNGNVGPSTTLGATVASALYFLRVRGVNACGTGAASSELDLTVACPTLSAPSGFTAVVTGGTVALHWSAVPSATSYLLEAGIAPSVWNRFVGAIGPAPTFAASNVPAGSYALRVRAQSACGVSAPSAIATAVVQ